MIVQDGQLLLDVIGGISEFGRERIRFLFGQSNPERSIPGAPNWAKGISSSISTNTGLSGGYIERYIVNNLQIRFTATREQTLRAIAEPIRTES